ncbi:NAD(P)-dependent oxidoreductase [Microbacterium sp. ASV81]|uniref:NAD(P)-dependent oxidoreductase n=1 Tax=Microbacterium capsulatum TaxID=3041921 RepID=A0ABU0XIP0_9MICO|nr:NAD(P)-dependent oxidoreductase [Microbacterium sp. ASV81]MDQ4215006.1 NAD(P)-dependent oxidoreductase [Microbacterium sp. ASV81]
MSLLVTVPTAELAADLLPLPEGVHVQVWDMATPPPAERIDIVVPSYLGRQHLSSLANISVGLVQGQMIGYETIIDRVPAGIPFANAASVHETGTAELAVGLVIAAQRELPRFVRAQDAGVWDRGFTSCVADRRVLLVGLGGVGRGIARRLGGFEASITAVAQSARTETVEGVGEIAVHPLSALPALLPEAEIVIVSLPGGSETHRLFDAAMLARMPDDALLVNVGRGTVVDTEALVAEGGRIRAALDVMDPEPLPEGHPLWTMPGVLFTPHIGGASAAMHPRIAALIRTQIDRMLAGEPPLNVIPR